ncbi:hypothetical protein BAUCODRAFT_323318 [Baudoinia panamericana UAMH 10762]|uniref:Uncharacterized protein n=1 Tax=Baudoinia panamericana (strain UAMH 10762) TaxID=717646 RepID=M2MJ55_BAUPA|nr:uncharacterized protein BAUCODRAFT_323318 [Baudoinia panamericana UAMH 10762]EMC91308.1 hypothetical protein BAUCODRAFT_323318 [Baudoinia panamericana UAMH 10762]
MSSHEERKSRLQAKRCGPRPRARLKDHVSALYTQLRSMAFLLPSLTLLRHAWETGASVRVLTYLDWSCEGRRGAVGIRCNIPGKTVCCGFLPGQANERVAAPT